jgi:hypothetical protein
VSVGPTGEVWIGADNGVLQRAVGGSWTLHLEPTFASYIGVWARAADDVWAVGEFPGPQSFQGVIQHWNGSAWTDESSGAPGSSYLWSVWGSGPSDVWVAGNVIAGPGLAGTVFHYDGSSWSTSLTDPNVQQFSTVWGSGPRDVWTGGRGGIHHYDGTAWTAVTASAGNYSVYGRVWGTAPDDVWASASNDGDPTATLLHYDGTAWSQASPPAGLVAQNGWQPSASDLWLVGGDSMAVHGLAYHYDGTAWSAASFGGAAPEELVSVSGSTGGAGGVWAIGAKSVLELQ